MTMGPKHKTFLVLRPFEGVLTCSILIAGTQVMLRKTYFLRSECWLRPESWTPRSRIANPEPNYWNADTNGPTAIIRPKSQFPNIRHDGVLTIGNFMLMINNHFALFQLPGSW
jgi:hypothetical protein